MKEPNLPPANIEAEEAILGGILFDPKAISYIEASLNPKAFYVYRLTKKFIKLL